MKQIIEKYDIMALKYFSNSKGWDLMELENPFGMFSTQLAYHKNKSISLPMSKFIEITLKHSAGWK